MTDWIAVVMSGIAIIISIITAYTTNKKINAQIEIEIKKMIDETKKAFTEKANDKGIMTNYLIEEELNAYDKACAFYKDNKVDKKRFKKDYYYEVNGLFENKNFKEIGKLNEESCKYNNLKDVYNEWKVK